MARHSYVVLTLAVPGREAEFDAWYDGQHLRDVMAMPGVVSARRFEVGWKQAVTLETPPWRSLAIYEIEADDPAATIAAIKAASGTAAMPMTDAMERSGMLQLLARPVDPADGEGGS